MSAEGAIVYAVVMAIILAAAIFGNLLILLAVYRTSTLKRTTAVILVINLASVDVLVSSFIIPFVIIVAITNTWKLPAFLCVATGFMNAFLTAAQLLALFNISVNRYIAVAFPHMYETRCTKKLTVLMVTAGWLYSLLWTLMPFFGWGKIGFDKGSLFCNTLWSKEHQNYAIVLQTMCYIIPALLAFVLYFRVYRKVRSRSKTFLKSFASTFSLNSLSGAAKGYKDDFSESVSQDGARNSHVNNVTVSNVNVSDVESQPDSAYTKLSKKRKKMEIRVTRTLLAVGFCFAVCWLPRCVANLWAAFASRQEVPKTLELVSTAFIFANSAVNPVIYAALHREFHTAFKKLLFHSSAKTANSNSNSGPIRPNFSGNPGYRKNSVPIIEMRKCPRDLESIQNVDTLTR